MIVYRHKEIMRALLSKICFFAGGTGIAGFAAIGIIAVLAFSVYADPRPNTADVLMEEEKKNDYATASGKPPQFVAISFDGSKSLKMWDDTMAFAEEIRSGGAPINLTYFISGAYFIPDKRVGSYIAPDGRAGASLIGFGGSPEDVMARRRKLDFARLAGHEIASHAVGHFPGSRWSLDIWDRENDSFRASVFESGSVPYSRDFGSLSFGPASVVGFRAPELSWNENMLRSLANKGYRYDASGIGDARDWPQKNFAGIWSIPLAGITIGSSRKETISMDYSIFMLQTGGRNIAKKGNALWSKLYSETFDAYKRYFTYNYENGRAPVVIGHHFSLWNDGVYFEALKDFASTTCRLPEVRCVSMSELADYLDYKDGEKQTDYQ